MPPKYFFLGFLGWVAHFDAMKKAVELRFRQRIRAVMLYWILRRDNYERARQYMRFIVDADFAFAHCLKQRALSFRRCAIELIRQHNIGKNGPSPEVK